MRGRPRIDTDRQRYLSVEVKSFQLTQHHNAPVLASQPQAPLCVMRRSIFSASFTHFLDGCLDSSPTKPTPHESLSFSGLNRPAAGGIAECASQLTSSLLPWLTPADCHSNERPAAAEPAPCSSRLDTPLLDLTGPPTRVGAVCCWWAAAWSPVGPESSMAARLANKEGWSAPTTINT